MTSPPDPARVRRLGLRWAGGGMLVGAAHVGIAAAFRLANPYETQILPPCLWHQVTGWECPGCGGIRAMYSLVNGDIGGSFAMNPLLIACYLAALLLAVDASTRFLGSLHRPWPTWVAIGLVAVAAAYTGIIRNLLGPAG